MDALEATYAAFPWLRQLGIGPQLLTWVKDGYTDEAIVGLTRQTEQWKQMFQGIVRPDGTLRMNESQYLQTKDAYSSLLFNYTGQRVTDSAQIKALLDNEVSPAEFEQRLQVWDTLQRDGGDVRSAFYVYAGMRLSDDDLYAYVVDPARREQLDAEYTQRAAATQLDYGTWITRAAEAGLQNVSDALVSMRNQGVATDEAIRRVQSLNPDMAVQMADLLYHGGAPTAGSYLGLSELLRAFELAMIGSEATQAGFTLPDQQRVEAFRQAGVDRQKALDSYATLASQFGQIQGITGRIGARFGQTEWESAQLLRRGPEVALLQQAAAQEAALGRASTTGEFAFDATGRLRQRGLTTTG